MIDLSTPRCADAADRARLQFELEQLGTQLLKDRAHREAQSAQAKLELQPAADECARMLRLGIVRGAIDAYDAGQATLAGVREADGGDLAHAFAELEAA